MAPYSMIDISMSDYSAARTRCQECAGLRAAKPVLETEQQHPARAGRSHPVR
jgi:hypothetical protein